MKHFKVHATIVIVLLFGAAACNIPVGPQPIIPQQTPDLTITALFEFITTAQAEQTNVAVPTSAPPTETASVTPPPVQATATTSAPPTPTNTALPTDTKVPTKAVSSGGRERSGSSVIAYYIQKEPTIDGVFDEWDFDRYSVSRVVYGDNRWNGNDDLSATLMIGWDDYYLYLAARVKDDIYVQKASGKNLFKGDSIEILLDANVSRDYNDNDLSNDDYQIGISPGQSTPSDDIETYLWYPSSKAGEYTSIKAAALPTDDGYRIEAKIPWEIFGITPDIGKHFGFAFSVSDNDKSSENVQQSMVSNVSTRHLTDPTTWGDLTLEGRR